MKLLITILLLIVVGCGVTDKVAEQFESKCDTIVVYDTIYPTNLATDYYSTRWYYKGSDTVRIYQVNHYGLKKTKDGFYEKEEAENAEHINDSSNTYGYGGRYVKYMVVKYVRDSITYDTICYEKKECVE